MLTRYLSLKSVNPRVCHRCTVTLLTHSRSSSPVLIHSLFVVQGSAIGALCFSFSHSLQLILACPIPLTSRISEEILSFTHSLTLILTYPHPLTARSAEEYHRSTGTLLHSLTIIIAWTPPLTSRSLSQYRRSTGTLPPSRHRWAQSRCGGYEWDLRSHYQRGWTVLRQSHKSIQNVFLWTMFV